MNRKHFGASADVSMIISSFVTSQVEVQPECSPLHALETQRTEMAVMKLEITSPRSALVSEQHARACQS